MKYLVLLVICVMITGVLALNVHTIALQHRCTPATSEEAE